MSATHTSHPKSGTMAVMGRQVYIQSPLEASMKKLGIDYWSLSKADEREAFQRMRRVQLGSDAPMYANLGRYYEPFEETVAPISALALKSAFPPIPPNKPPPPAPCGDEDPLGGTATPHQLLEDTSPVRHSVRLSQVFRPMSISPAPVLDYLATPASPSGINAEPDVTRIDSRHAEDLKPIDRAKETEEYTEVTGDEYIPAEGANEEEGYTAYGPPNRRGQKSIRHIRERAAPYSLEGNAPNRVHKPRIVTDEDDFPRPSIPNPDSARQQADFNAGKHKWWSQRVLRPLLSASPKPLSKHAILSIIKKDLGLTGDAWKAFHDEHLNSISQTLTAGAKVGGSKGAVFVRLGRPDQIRGGWWSIARVEGRSDVEIKEETGGWVLCTPTPRTNTGN